MATNPPDPTEGFPATKSKAVTEEDVRVSNRLKLDDFFSANVSDDERRQRKAEMELKLIARFETLFDPLVYLGSAGSFRVDTSELRVMAARAISSLMFDVETGFANEVRGDNERIEKEQQEAAKAFEEQKKQHDKDDSVPDPTVDTASIEEVDRSTQPEAELEYLQRTSGKTLEDVSDKLPRKQEKEDTGPDSAPRRENTTPATGTADAQSKDSKPEHATPSTPKLNPESKSGREDTNPPTDKK